GSSKIRGIDTVLGTDPKKVKYKTLGRCFWDWGVFTDVKVTSRERDMELRRTLKPDLKPENEFEEIMIENIMNDIPIAVIEGYRESYDNLKKLYRHMPEAVITYGSGGTNPGGIVLSWLSENGVEINSIYKVNDVFMMNQDYIYRNYCIYDNAYVFFRTGEKGCIRAPMFSYIKPGKPLESYERKYIRWFERGEFQYRYKAFQPYLIMDSDYFDSFIRFFLDFASGLSKEKSEVTLFRPREYDNFGMDRYIKDVNPDISIDYGLMNHKGGGQVGGDISELLYDTALVICETCTTSVLFQALARDIPSIVITKHTNDENYYSKETLKLQEEMKEMGLLYDDASKACEFINGCDDFGRWWNEPDRRRFTDRLTENYAFHLDDTSNWWVEEIKRMHKKAGNRGRDNG
ncbi:MAG: hypothetical protein K5886_08670, partial [Lachnospiraceae bacterium]|nr:hypothetical protein [Lachnospiraceae bacterium]